MQIKYKFVGEFSIITYSQLHIRRCVNDSYFAYYYFQTKITLRYISGTCARDICQAVHGLKLVWEIQRKI